MVGKIFRDNFRDNFCISHYKKTYNHNVRCSIGFPCTPPIIIDFIGVLFSSFYPQVVPNRLRNSNPPATRTGQYTAPTCLRDDLYLSTDALLQRRNVGDDADQLTFLL